MEGSSLHVCSDKENIQIELITRLNDKIIKNSDDIIDLERFMLDDADIAVIAVSVSAAFPHRLAAGIRGVNAPVAVIVHTVAA